MRMKYDTIRSVGALYYIFATLFIKNFGGTYAVEHAIYATKIKGQTSSAYISLTTMPLLMFL
jgi:hypothetical protein